MTEYLEIKGKRIAYDVTGEGPLVVLAPGMGDMRASYRFLAPKLANAGYRVVTTDVRGHGESSTGWESYTNTDAGHDLAALIRHLGGSAIVVGHSFSGGSATWLASEDPSLVVGLVLLEAFTRPITMNPLMKQALRIVLSSPALWGMSYPSLYKGPKPGDFPAYRKALKANLREPGRMAAARAIGLGTKTDLAGRLSRIEVPALLVFGSKSPDFPDPRAEADTVAGELAGPTEIVMIEGAGHYPHVEFPEQTADAILGFLNKTVRA
jgi:pimeloyl-ACP methyl ester carboxylesterase